MRLGGHPVLLNRQSAQVLNSPVFFELLSGQESLLCSERLELTFCSLLTDEEMMATEVTPSAMEELTDLGKCLMKHEVGGGQGDVFSFSSCGEPVSTILTL